MGVRLNSESAHPGFIVSQPNSRQLHAPKKNSRRMKGGRFRSMASAHAGWKLLRWPCSSASCHQRGSPSHDSVAACFGAGTPQPAAPKMHTGNGRKCCDENRSAGLLSSRPKNALCPAHGKKEWRPTTYDCIHNLLSATLDLGTFTQ